MPKTIMQQLLEQKEKEDRPEEKPVSDSNNSLPLMTSPLKNYPSGNTSMPRPEPPQTAEYDSVKDELRMIDEEKNYQLRKLRQKKIQFFCIKAFQVLLIGLCVYLVFLIYGVLNTNYVYDERGNVVPLVVPVNDIRQKADFEVLSTQYYQGRTLYEEVLKLDYRLGMAASTGEDPLLIAPEYEKILEKVTSLSVQMSAQTVPAQYTQVYNMLLNWVKNDLALYCQYISRAITMNSVADMNKSQEYKESMYNVFMRITEITATLGAQVENVDVSSLYKWSPEAFIEQYSGGISNP